LVHSSKFATAAPSSTNTETETSTTPDKKKPKKKASGGASRHAFCSRSHDTLALTVATTTEDDTAVVDVPVPHINILWYLLVSAERSWAHSNQLQKSGTAKRQQVLKKLKRATQWADLLLQKVQRTADAGTVKECQAYCAWMSANLAMEKLNYPVSVI
jgi:RNA-binding signal recognition particle 68